MLKIYSIIKVCYDITLDSFIAGQLRQHCSGKDKIKGQSKSTEYELDLIIEENGILSPVEIKQGTRVSAEQAAALSI